MSHYGTEAQRVRAQVALDNESPPEMSDEEELIADWIDACPVSLNGFALHDLQQLVTSRVNRN